MNEKTLNNRELLQIKRIAMNVDGDYRRIETLKGKIKTLVEEIKDIQSGIDIMESPVINMTGGYKSTDIYKKVIVPKFNPDGSPKLDKDGRQIKETKYTLRYEDSILPPTVDPETTEPTESVELGPTGFNDETPVEEDNND